MTWAESEMTIARGGMTEEQAADRLLTDFLPVRLRDRRDNEREA